MTRITAEKYKVTIRYMNGHVQTYTGSLAYCRRVRAQAFRMCHGWFGIELAGATR